MTGYNAPVGYNEPIPYNGEAATQQWLYLPGSGTDRVRTSDKAALDITGDLDIRARLALDDWTPSQGSHPFVWKQGNAYSLNVTTDGRLELTWGSGVTVRSATSTVATGFNDGTAHWVRATLDVDNGASQRVVTFYTSDDGDTWAQLGSAVTGAVTSVNASTAVLDIGLTHPTGKLFTVEIRDGIDGTLVADPDFTDPAEWSEGATVGTDSTGNTWTLIQSGADPIRIVAVDFAVTIEAPSPTFSWSATPPTVATDVIVTAPSPTITWEASAPTVTAETPQAVTIDAPSPHVTWQASAPALILTDRTVEKVRTGLEYRIFDRDDWNTQIKVVPRAFDRQFLVELNDVGYGQFSLDGDDALFTDAQGRFNAGEFQIGNVVRCYYNGILRGAWRIEEREFDRINDSERPVWTFRGTGLAGALGEAVVMSEAKALDPSNRIQKLTSDERPFTFASYFYDTDWDEGWAPPTFAGATVDVTTGTPDEWPDLQASWITAFGAPYLGSEDNDSGLQYFRNRFTTDSAVLVTVFAMAAGGVEVFIDGESVLEHRGYRDIGTVEIQVPAGVHQVAVRYNRSDESKLALSIGDRTGFDDGEPVYTWLLRTDDTWDSLTGAWPPPAWTPGQVMRQLIDEAVARAEESGQPSAIANIVPTFSGTHDSDGNEWTQRVDRYWQLGTDLLSVLLELTESSCEFFMSPTGKLHLYTGERGEDKTTGDAPVIFRPGHNVTRLKHVRRKGLGNHVIARHAHGWMERHRQPQGASRLIQRREAFLSLGTADSKAEAARIIDKQLDLEGGNTEVTEVTLLDVAGARPFAEWHVGDYVLAPHQKAGGGLILRPEGTEAFVSHRDVSIGVVEDEHGEVTFHPELVLADSED